MTAVLDEPSETCTFVQGSRATAKFVDWNRDGDLDILVGPASCLMWLLLQERLECSLLLALLERL